MMKLTLLLMLLVALTVNHQTESKKRINWRKVWKVVKTVAKIAAAVFLKKRDVSEFDKNMDGFVDESELEDMFTTREARQVLEMADQDGNSQVTSEEFQQLMTELSTL